MKSAIGLGGTRTLDDVVDQLMDAVWRAITESPTMATLYPGYWVVARNEIRGHLERILRAERCAADGTRELPFTQMCDVRDFEAEVGEAIIHRLGEALRSGLAKKPAAIALPQAIHGVLERFLEDKAADCRDEKPRCSQSRKSREERVRASAEVRRVLSLDFVDYAGIRKDTKRERSWDVAD